MSRTITLSDEDFEYIQEALLHKEHEATAEAEDAEFLNFGWAQVDTVQVASKTTEGVLESTIGWNEDGTYRVTHRWSST